MSFPENIRLEVRKKSAFRCCRCHEIGIDIHHIIPQSNGGSDDIENATPLCQNCHDRFGDNVQKRKEITQMRDWWYSVVEEKYGSSEQYKNDLAQLSKDIKKYIDEHHHLLTNLTSSSESRQAKPDKTHPPFAAKNIDKYVTVDSVHDKNAFALEVKGRSMLPRIQNGDIIVVSPRATVKSGDICVVRVGDEDTLKIVNFDGDNIHLIPLNPSYAAMTIPKSQVAFIWKVIKLIADI